jgi:hypothetical protein
MLNRVFYITFSAYLFATFYYLMMPSDWLPGDRQHSKGDDYYTGRSPLTSDQPANLQPTEPTRPVVQSHTAAVHAGATLIKLPPAKVVHSNTAAVHDGATLIKLPPAKVVHSNTAAVHDGATLIKWPPAKVVHSNMAAVHDGATLIKWPPVKVVQTNTGAVRIGETVIKPPQSPPANSGKPKSPPSMPAPSKFVQTSTGAVPKAPVSLHKREAAPSSRRAQGKVTASTGDVTHEPGAVKREPKAKSSKIPPKPAGSQLNRISRKPVETSVTGKRKPRKVRTATEQRNSNDGRMTVMKSATQSIASTEVTSTTPKPGKRAGRRLRMTTETSHAAKVETRRVSDGNEVRRAVERLNGEDRRAFRSRCGKILSAPEKFARAHVEICNAASL